MPLPKTYQRFIGWDISKADLHYCVFDTDGQAILSGKINNTPGAITDWIDEQLERWQLVGDQLLNCLENTGHYSNLLLRGGLSRGLSMWMQDPLHLKMSLGRRADKTDQADAYHIGRYCWLHACEATLYELPAQCVEQLRYLVRQRLRLVSQRQGLRTSRTESSPFQLYPADREGELILDTIMAQLSQAIKGLDERIDELLKEDEELRRITKIVRSVPGFGARNTPVVMALTGMFKKIRTAKACASYAGISPHQTSSGTSLRRRPAVNKLSSRALKAAIHQGAKFLIMPQCEGSIFKALYDRLRAKGRSYRQAINAVRNKMVTVLFACLNKNQVYQEKLHQSLA